MVFAQNANKKHNKSLSTRLSVLFIAKKYYTCAVKLYINFNFCDKIFLEIDLCRGFMKKIRNFLLVIFIIAFAPLFWACGATSLSVPNNVSLNRETNVLSWSAVEGAEYYGVDINGKVHQSTTTNLDITSYIQESGEYQIKVRAISVSKGFVVSDYSEPIKVSKKIRLATPEISINNKTGELSWQKVENAYYYVLSINGINYSTSENEFNLYESTPFDDFLVRGQNNLFKVYCAPTSNYLNSYFSQEVEIYLADTQASPKNVKVEKFGKRYICSFDAVETAVEYEIELDSKVFSTRACEIDLTSYLKIFGLKYVTVQAKEVRDSSDKLLYMKSSKSIPAQFEYIPEFVGTTVQNISVNNKTKVLSFSDVRDALIYEIKVDDIYFEVKTNEVDLSKLLTEPKNYEISVVAKNGEYETDNTSIQYKNIIKLDAPQFSFVEPSTSREIERHINIQTRYSIPVVFKIYFNTGYIETSQRLNIDVTDYLEIGTNDVYIEVVCDDEFYRNATSAVQTYDYYISATATNLQIDQNKVLTFNGSQSLTESYNIYVKLNGQNWSEPILNTKQTSISLVDYLTNVGKYNIGVSIVDNNIESQISSINYVISTTLTAPQNLSVIQQLDGKALLSFDQVQNAQEYQLYIDGSLKYVLDSNESNDITNYVNIGSDTIITLKSVGDNEIYLTSQLSAEYVFKYVKDIGEINQAYIEANQGKYYLYFEPIENFATYNLSIQDSDENMVLNTQIMQTNYNTTLEMYVFDIDEVICNTDNYTLTITANINNDYYSQTPKVIQQNIKTYNLEEYNNQNFFYYGKYYSYAPNSSFELGEAVLHAILYRKSSIEVYLNWEYDGIENAYTSQESLIQSSLPLINNLGVNPDEMDSSNALSQLFSSLDNLSQKIELIERGHDQLYLYVTGESQLTSQKSNRVYTITFDYSNAGKYQADQSNSQSGDAEYVGLTTSKVFPIDSCQEVEVETVNQLVMVASYGKKPKFINQNLSQLNYIAQNTYNAARYILSQICNDGMTEVEKVKAIHDWIVLNNNYDYTTYQAATGAPFTSDNLSDMGFFASGALLKNLSVCTGYAQAFSLMCGIMGIKSVTTFGLVGDGVNWAMVDFDNMFALLMSGLATNINTIGAHSWNRVYISTPQHSEKEWYIVDCTWDDYSGIVYDYFLKTDSDVSNTRKELYPNGTYYHEKDEFGVTINYSATTIYSM